MNKDVKLDKKMRYPMPVIVEAPCEAYCPVNLKAHTYISLMAEGDFEKAYRIIRQKMPFPLSIGFICDHPCEAECRRGLVGGAVAIRDLKRAAAEYAYEHDIQYRESVKTNREERVAIVGAGPAGLSAAYDLACEGFQVTVFESLPVAGGMMAVGCPEFKLPKKILKKEIKNVTDLGVEIKLNTPVKSIGSLFEQGYKAVFIAVGTHEGHKLPIPGADLKKDVIDGVSFLRKINLGKPVKLGKKVLVLGGGGVAIDCARAAVRLGAKVSLACLESREKMPALAEHIMAGEKEGIVIYPSRAFTRILSEDGKVTGVECLNLRSMAFDEQGKLKLSIVKGSEHVLSADSVIFATGQVPDLNFISKSDKLGTTGKGFIIADPETLETNVKGVFAGGDAVTNSGSVITAIASGQRAALSITSYLNGEVPSASLVRQYNELIAYPAVVPSPERIEGGAKRLKVEGQAYTANEAKKEASRCIRCDLTYQALREGVGPRERSMPIEQRESELEKWGMAMDSEVMRRALLGGLRLYGKYRRDKVKTVIQTGCFAWGTPYPLISLVRLLQHFDRPYRFLDFEMCCGAPMFVEAKTMTGNEAERKVILKRATQKAREYVNKNIEASKAIGGEDIYQMCQWCTYIDRKYAGKTDIGIHFYGDLLVELVNEFKPKLKYDGAIGYFAGGRHRNAHYYLPSIPDLDWPSYRAICDKVQGLKVVDLPNYCCVTYPDLTWERMKKEGLDTLVTTCITCYGRFIRRAPEGIRVLGLSDFLLEAVTGERLDYQFDTHY